MEENPLILYTSVESFLLQELFNPTPLECSVCEHIQLFTDKSFNFVAQFPIISDMILG